MLIRPACAEDAAGIARVHVDCWRTTYKGIVPQDFLDKLSYTERVNSWITRLSNPASKVSTFVAVGEAQQIAGFVSGGPERNNDPVYKGELYAIYIFQEHQGRGLGRRLAITLVERLLQMGYDSMLLWVLADNPACQFYEALGGRAIKTANFEIGGATLEEVAYGWLDVRKLPGVTS